jgi:aspartate racemase
LHKTETAKGGDFTKELGVIGGMGPLATAYFMELVVRMTDAGADYEHIPMIILNRPEIPDRTSYIIGKSDDSPLDAIIKAGNQLADHYVDYIAIPCVTAYYFYRQLQEGIRAPIINMIEETAVCLKEEGIRKVGLMATDGTISSGFFREGLNRYGIAVVEPSAEGQRCVMDIIYGSIKANQPVQIEVFNRVDRELRQNGAEAVILGCTELSMIHRDFPLGPGFLDSMEALARKSVLACEGRLKKEYLHLITK